MSLIKKFLAALMRRLPVFDITKPDPQDPQRQVLYLRRITLLEIRGRRMCLHLIYRSDEDRDPHDHPWDFITCVLSKPYRDEQWSTLSVPDAPHAYVRFGPDFVRMPRFRPVYRRAEHLHRVIIDEQQTGPSITLVFMGKQRRRWGFSTATGHVYWRDYLNIPASEPLRED